MSYEVIQPPTSEQSLAKLGEEVLLAAKELGRPMDVEGFLQAWLSGLRVIAERNAENKITGLALLAVGRRWLFQDVAATVVWKKAKDDAALLNYIKMLASALGAVNLYVETDKPLEETDSFTRYEIVQHVLRK